MSKGVFAVMSGLLCMLAGMKHAAALKADAARLQRWGYILQHLELLLQEGAMSIPDALHAAADSRHPPDTLIRSIAARLQTFPMLSLEDAFGQCCEEWPERDLLQRMFIRLGQGSKESRILAVGQAAREMQLLCTSATVKAEKDSRLWQTLGITGGICLFILFL